VKGPLFGLDREIRLGALDVDEGNKDVGDRNLSSLDDVRDELGKLGVLAGAGDRTSARRRGSWETKGKVDDLSGRLNKLFDEAPGDLQVEKSKQLGGVLGRRDEGSWVERHLL